MYPADCSIVLAEKPSKAETFLKRTVSPVDRPCPGSVTVIVEELADPVRKGLKGRSTSTAGSTLAVEEYLSG